MWYVYFLELSNGDIYIGSTNDLRRRFASHQQGHVISTSKYLPVLLRSYVAVAVEATARSLERYSNPVLEKLLQESVSSVSPNRGTFSAPAPSTDNRINPQSNLLANAS